MARMMVSVNMPPCAETPIKTVGFAFFTTSRSPILLGCSHAQPATRAASCTKGAWKSRIPFMPSTSNPSRSMA
jgi:hypothetical protein